jgi:hypothetical protein
MTGSLQETTLTPLSVLLSGWAGQLEHLLPHLADDAWVTVNEVVLGMRQIVRSRVAVVVDELPDYCTLTECQNMAGETAFCPLHEAEFRGWLGRVL